MKWVHWKSATRYNTNKENLAKKINLVEKQLEEKNEMIESILKKFDYFDILEGEITAKTISAKNFKCKKCDFNTHSEQG